MILVMATSPSALRQIALQGEAACDRLGSDEVRNRAVEVKVQWCERNSASELKVPGRISVQFTL